MKFRNKETKEIRKAEMRDDGIYLYSETAEEWRKCDWKVLAKYWEEYREEPKDFWYIDADGKPFCEPSDDRCEFDNNCKEIGNYFSSREKAELAVRKLKAWKRLKDGGFVFCGKGDCLDTIRFDYGPAGYNNQDFDLLFGGEE